jgi:hypothetical protein
MSLVQEGAGLEEAKPKQNDISVYGLAASSGMRIKY